VEAWDNVSRSEKTNPRGHVYASDSIVTMAPRVVPEQVPAEHPKEKGMFSVLLQFYYN
jgi:hypothetical protein